MENTLPTAPAERITQDIVHHDDSLLHTRATLLERLRNWEDQTSWQQFFDTYWGLIYGVARRTGLNDAEAQDVVQETMAAVARHMPSFRYNPAIGSFKAWLLKMTHWRITDQLRKRKPGAVPQGTATATATVTAATATATGAVAIDNLIDPASLSLDAIWEAEWEKNLLQAALASVKRKIDPEKFQIFDFYVNKEWPAEKVAESFGTSAENVHLIKHRITRLLKEEVKRLEKEMM